MCRGKLCDIKLISYKNKLYGHLIGKVKKGLEGRMISLNFIANISHLLLGFPQCPSHLSYSASLFHILCL